MSLSAEHSRYFDEGHSYYEEDTFMNVGEFRSLLKDIPDDGLVVFQPIDADASFSFPAMAVTLTVKQIVLPDGKVSKLAVVGLSSDDRKYQLLTGTGHYELYKYGGFYVTINNHRFFDGLPDDGYVVFQACREAYFSLGKDFFPAIGVVPCAGQVIMTGLTILPDDSESTYVMVELLPR